MCVHMGLDKAIFVYSNFNKIINELNKFFDEHLTETFKTNYPKLIHSSKWKFDYVITRKNFSSNYKFLVWQVKKQTNVLYQLMLEIIGRSINVMV